MTKTQEPGFIESVREDPVKRRRAIRFAVIWVSTFLIVGCLLVAGKAHAQCRVGPESSCPSPHAFAKKWNHGFFHHAHGIPTKKVFKTPQKDHDKFVNKYETLYKHASKKMKHRLYNHAAHLAGKSKVTSLLDKWDGKEGRGTTCFFPLTPYCQASLEWTSLVSGVKCGMWRSPVDATNKFTCDRFDYNGRGIPCGPASCQKPLTWTEFRNGVKLVACSVVTGAAIVMAVGTKGGAPLLSAAGTASACAVAAFESVS